MTETAKPDRDQAPTAEHTFTVRRYECDLYGHLNNAQYLRYVDAIDELLPPPAGPVARIRIEFLQAPEAGARLEVAGAIAERRGRWEVRHYAFRHEEREITRVEVERHPAPGPGREPAIAVAPAPPRPAGTLTYRRPVEWRDVDVSGRVAPAGLAALAEDAGIRVCAAHDWPMTRCSEHGFGIILRRHEIELGEPVGLEDELDLATWASDVRRSMATRHYLLCRARDGAPAARFRSLYVWVKLATGRPIRIPSAFLTSFRKNFADDGTFPEP